MCYTDERVVFPQRAGGRPRISHAGIWLEARERFRGRAAWQGPIGRGRREPDGALRVLETAVRTIPAGLRSGYAPRAASARVTSASNSCSRSGSSSAS
jgi:hypothetical protein